MPSPTQPAATNQTQTQPPVDTSHEYELTDKERTEFKERFNLFDTNKDGKITIDELKEVEISLDMNPTERHLEKEFNDGDIDKNGGIDFDEFCQGMVKQKQRDLEKTEKEIKNTFNLFDVNEDGEIDLIELKEGFDKLDIHRTDAQFDHMLKTADKDGDGQLSYAEFYEMVLDEASQTPNDSTHTFTVDLDQAEQYVNNKYGYIGVGVVLFLLLCCIIRAIYKRCRRKKMKIYHALTVINQEMEDEREDLNYNL